MLTVYKKSPLREPRRRDRNSSAVPPFLAGLSGSLTQPALCSPDIAGSAPHLSCGTPRPVPSSYPGGSQHTETASSFSVGTVLMYYSSSSSRSLGIAEKLMCILPEFHGFVNHKLHTLTEPFPLMHYLRITMVYGNDTVIVRIGLLDQQINGFLNLFVAPFQPSRNHTVKN